MELFIDAAEKANFPVGSETPSERLERYKTYFRVMYVDYGNRWLDTYIGQHTSFTYNDPDAFAQEINGMFNFSVFFF